MIAGLFLCVSAIAVDGATLSCADPAIVVRLEGVAPAAEPTVVRDVLTYLLGQYDGKAVSCLSLGQLASDGSTIARCSVDGRDLGQSLIGFGLARISQ